MIRNWISALWAWLQVLSIDSFTGTFIVGKNSSHFSRSLCLVPLVKVNFSLFQLVPYLFFNPWESGSTYSFSLLSHVHPSSCSSGTGPKMIFSLAPSSEGQYLTHEKHVIFPNKLWLCWPTPVLSVSSSPQLLETACILQLRFSRQEAIVSPMLQRAHI